MKQCTVINHYYSKKPEYGEMCQCGKFPWAFPEIERRPLVRKNSMTNVVVNLNKYRAIKQVNKEVEDYRAKLNKMDKLQLLEEMVAFQEWRSKSKELTSEMIVKGLILFPLLTRSAETKELRLLTSAYTRHLEYELAEKKKDKPLPPGA